jgi:hypothetical protein
MLTLPDEMVALLASCLALRAPGRRMVSSALRAVGLG